MIGTIKKKNGKITINEKVISKKDFMQFIVMYKNYKTIMNVDYVSEPVGMDMNGYPYTYKTYQKAAIFDREKNKFVGAIGKEVEIIKVFDNYDKDDKKFEKEVFKR